MTERETIQCLGNFAKLYRNDSMNVLMLHELIKKQYKKLSDLVYISHALPAYISDFFADFVSGDTDDLQIILDPADAGQQEELDVQIYENDLKEQVNDWATSQSEFGSVPLYTYLDDESNVIYEDIPNDQYFPQTDGSVIIATYKRDPSGVTGKELILLTQHFHLENGKVTIDRQVWKTDEKGVNTLNVTIDVWNKLTGRTLRDTDMMDIDELPFVQADNGRKTKDGYGKSDYADIMPQLAEINERRTQMATQFLKNLDAKMILPKSAENEDGTPKEFDTLYIDTKEQDVARFMTPDSTLFAEAEEHIMSQIRLISTVTGVPLWVFTKGTAPERVESLRIQLFAAIRKTHRKRAKLRRAMQDIIRIGFKLTGTALTADPIIKFGDVLPEDDLIVAETQSTLVRSGLQSHRSAIMKLGNMTEEDAQKELDQIEAENKIAGFAPIDTNAPPVLPIPRNP